mmetsp:Transcript_37649/g.55475  ORF Transcript_37649/g.55475 Transcript_37649/m.55475 type:complete len:231 (+) Transcript_37649:450-1142(+)
MGGPPSRGSASGYGGDSRRPTASERRKTSQRQSADGFTEVVGSGGRAPRVAHSSYLPSYGRSAPSGRERAAAPPPAAPVQTGPPPLTDAKLKIRIGSIRQEFIMDPYNEKELLLSIDELSTTPDAMSKLVSINCEKALDCKDAERKGIIQMISLLATKGKVQPNHVEPGLWDLLEFMQDFVVDIPLVYQYMGDMLTAFLKAKAVRMSWLKESVAKLPKDVGEKIMSKVQA